MKQVMVIHGGDSFATYEEYLGDLMRSEVTLEGWGKGWKSSLSDSLGPNYQIILPRMPNAQNAKYLEWKIQFEKYTPLLNDEVILVGHSLGGCFLAKYLAEYEYPKKILGTLLVAPPYDTDGTRALVEFDPPESLALLEERGGRIFLYQSTDDPIVPYAELAKYCVLLPQATVRSFTDRGHFDGEEFPELVADIKSL